MDQSREKKVTLNLEEVTITSVLYRSKKSSLNQGSAGPRPRCPGGRPRISIIKGQRRHFPEIFGTLEDVDNLRRPALNLFGALNKLTITVIYFSFRIKLKKIRIQSANNGEELDLCSIHQMRKMQF